MDDGRVPDFVLVAYGGAFNPPHSGCEPVIRRTLFRAGWIALVSSRHHILGKHMGDFELCHRWLARLVWQTDPRRVYCEPIETGSIPDCPAAYGIDLLEAPIVHNGLALTWIALLIGADNETELPCFERAAESYWCFGRLAVEERLSLYNSMICRRLREGLVIPEAWCLPEVKDELYYYGGERQAV